MAELKYQMKERQRATRYQIIREESSAIEIAVLYWEIDEELENGHAVIRENLRAANEEHILAGKVAIEWDFEGQKMDSYQPEIFRFGRVLVVKYTQIEWKEKEVPVNF